MENQNNIHIIFSDKAYLAFDKISNELKLNENAENDLERIKNGKLPKIVILNSIIKNFARKSITEKDLINSLQKELEISNQTAEQILKDINAEIIPFVEKVPADKLDKIEQIKNPKSDLTPLSPIKNTKEKEPKKIPEKPIQQERPMPRGPDSYRDPIE